VRNGRRFGARYAVFGVSPEFEPGAGLVARPGIVQTAGHAPRDVLQRATALVQSYGGNVLLDGLWKYDDLRRRRPMLERKLHLTGTAQLRGGWSGGASVLVEEFRYDPDLYADYWVDRPRGDGSGARDTVRFVGTPALPTSTGCSPSTRRSSGSSRAPRSSSGGATRTSSSGPRATSSSRRSTPSSAHGAAARGPPVPAAALRAPSDGSVVSVRHIPRAKLEYQVARPVFVRLVGQYIAASRDSLRDDSRTNAPILLRRPDGSFARPGAVRNGSFRGDALFSWQPNPGTVFFAGYGSTLADPRETRLGALRRVQDGFFVKYSYLWRVSGP
jgi:hypothetical protein